MKKLQNNFTTPEQSKRLLEIGIPADSADCYIDNRKDEISFGEVFVRHKLLLNEKQFIPLINGEHIIPCWSVGRLIEIFLLCTPYKEISLHNENLVEQMVESIFMVHKDGLIDFSKLED